MPPPPKTGIPPMLVQLGVGYSIWHIIQRGPAHPDRTFGELLPLATQLQATAGPKTAAALTELEPLAVQRWGSVRLGDLTIADFVAWLKELRHPATGKGHNNVARDRLGFELYFALYADIVEAAVGETPVAAVAGLIPAWTASGASPYGGGAAGIGIALGNLLGRKTGKHGHAEAIAHTVPGPRGTGLWVTPSHLVLTNSDGESAHCGTVAWQCDRSQVAGIALHPHLQMLRRLDLCFTDESKCGYYFVGKGVGPRLQELLGKA